MRAAGGREEVISLYRAVAKAELEDLAQMGFRQHPDEVPFHLIDVQVPTAIAEQVLTAKNRGQSKITPCECRLRDG